MGAWENGQRVRKGSREPRGGSSSRKRSRVAVEMEGAREIEAEFGNRLGDLLLIRAEVGVMKEVNRGLPGGSWPE